MNTWTWSCAVALVSFGIAASAQGQSEQCSWLQSQYSSAVRQNGGDIGRRLAQLQATADRMNCGGGFMFFFGPGPAPGCTAVVASIRQLQSELGRRQFTGNFAQLDLQSIRDELRYNGCAIPEATYGAARTICVRSCDGYYFPISFNASRGRWKVDAEACQSMYGAAGQAELYTYNSDGDVADAKSLTGKRYGDQPFAFNYRTAYSPVCAAQLQQGIAALGKRYLVALLRTLPRSKEKQQTVAAAVPRPRARPIEFEDPETMANRDGHFVPREVAEQPLQTVRQIGPSYYAQVHSTLTLAPSRSTWWGTANAAEAPAAIP